MRIQREATVQRLVLDDGRAGHLQQSLALMEALGGPFDVVALRRARLRWQPVEPIDPEVALVLVGAGRRCAAAARDMRNRHRAHFANVQILDPRWGRSAHDVLLIPRHDQVEVPTAIRFTAALTAIDDDWLAAAGAAAPAMAELPTPRIGIVVGGEAAGLKLSDALIGRIVERAAALRGTDGCILATTSPRTPVRAAELLEQALAPHSARFQHFSTDAGSNPWSGMLATVTHWLAPADSPSILSQLVATRAAIEVFGSTQVVGRHRRLVDALQRSGRIQAFDNTMPNEPPSTGPVVPIREIDQIADEVWSRLPQWARGSGARLRGLDRR